MSWAGSPVAYNTAHCCTWIWPDKKMQLVNSRPEVAKPSLLWSLLRVWGQWVWRSLLPGHTQLPSGRKCVFPGLPTGGCLTALFLCSGTLLGPEHWGGEEERGLCPHTALVWSWSPLDARWKSDPHSRAVSAPASSLRTARSAVQQTAHLLLNSPSSHRSQGGILLRTSFITAQKGQCLCGPDKSLLAIKTVAHCEQQTLTKNYQQTESLFPSSPMRLIFCRDLYSSNVVSFLGSKPKPHFVLWRETVKITTM